MEDSWKFDAESFLETIIYKIKNKNIKELDLEKFVHELEIVLQELKEYKYYELDYKEILDHFYDAIYITDGNGKTVYVNKAYTRITGVQPDEVIGRSVEEILKEGKLYKNAVSMEVIKHKKQINSLGKSLKNGKEFLVTGIPIIDSNGGVKRVVVNDREVTDLIKIL